MKINVQWLKDYVEIRETVEELAEALTMAGLEVEGVEGSGDDTVLEIGVTPNRPDWLSHLGVAREVAAIFQRTMTPPDAGLAEEGPEVEAYTSIDIEDPDACTRYSGRVLTGIAMGPSPEWVSRRLESVGIRSISNVVDATNYVMMEMGQPLHAFDFNRLAENRIVVRKAGQGEKLRTLDGSEQVLESSDLLICDGLGPVALAGVMGGADSEVGDKTVDLLLESACFDPSTIRRTAKRLGLSTEASYRFERGSDPAGTVAAVDRLARLISEWAGGTVCRGVWDAHPAPEEVRKVAYRPDRVSRYLGVDVGAEEAASILRRLGLAPEEGSGDRWTITAPGFRRDLHREEDVIEEVARIYGYQNVPVTMPVGTTVPVKPVPIEKIQDRTREVMEGLGFSEALTYSFIDPSDLSAMGLDGGMDPVRILNPLSEEMEVMRTSVLPGLLKVLRTNWSRRMEDLALYEVGRVFLPCAECELPEERIRIGAVLSGRRTAKSWYGPEQAADFFDLKGAAVRLLRSLGLEEVSFSEMEIPYLQAGQSAWVSAGEIPLGPLGTLHPDLRDRYRIKGWAGCMELDLNHLERAETGRRFTHVPQYPGLLRDLAVMVPADVPAASMETVIREAGQDVAAVRLFDLYQGKGVPSGFKSLAYALVFQSPERTLTDAEADDGMERILEALKGNFGAERR